MKRTIALLLTIGTLSLTACDKATNGAGACDNVACTAIYVTISVNLQDINKNDVSLSSYYVIRKSTGDTVTIPHTHVGIPNSSPYPVFSDYHLDWFKNQSDFFRFVGIMNGQVVVDQEFFISADCCHIKKESGPETVIVQ